MIKYIYIYFSFVYHISAFQVKERNIFVIHNHAYFDLVKKVIRGGVKKRNFCH
ncbi:hypothetical protein GLOIN_2v1614624 [Rhizophagus irregularis DAOM 181602=DAOM 197198]|uniref:Uncharacterized protein n=1 Tax=Rhizophagus irregularis (strain DAOM 181602 / DAOM 197198 / MUCL 43194) TaxID=747089 RepID=A0A2P4PYU1_RHIID|nr:hypothetical protein GLOIN_2v1614624 [Rhizophagus irregularis DAOM 181602=DAOM 197198]POG70552.1 hypothetical protein GLOIN_2v1614624 [Rhizophagus irregularis DAOM 181602=DAOM 197198]|eukprot:XP_025177418.1 hypothetical protein GLOIN_2v1614624 [Rhizophagus irregularis DAOM 181602=DAOM 197198]